MLSVLPQLPHVCKAYTPPLSCHPFVGPHTKSLSWHHSRACCRNVLSMCISRSRTKMSLPSSSMRAHLSGYPRRLAKMWGCILASSYCSRKASTSKRQSMYITSTPGLIDLKIGIFNLTGASCFLSLLPLWPLHLCWWPAVSLAVEYPSESGAPLSGEEGGKSPLPTVVHWDFSGLPHSHTVPAWVASLASVLSPIPEVLPSC